jgi:hypothetical protein
MDWIGWLAVALVSMGTHIMAYNVGRRHGVEAIRRALFGEETEDLTSLSEAYSDATQSEAN